MALNTTEWGGDGTVKALHLSGRHVLALLLTSIYWVGEGFWAVYLWVFRFVESHRSPFPVKLKDKSSFIVLGALLAVMLVLVLPKTLKPQRYERLSEKWAGTWIKNQAGEGMTIFTSVPRAAFYAEGSYEYVDLGKNTIDVVKASMARKKALYLVMRIKDFPNYQEEAKLIERDFVEVIRFEQEGIEKIIIYKIIS